MATIEKDRILSFRGQDLRDNDGGKIGTIEEIYLDTQTGEPEWALVHTGLFGTKQTFVPIARRVRGRRHPAGAVREVAGQGCPEGRSGRRSSPRRRRPTLYRHYGMSYSESDSDSGVTAAARHRADGDSDRRHLVARSRQATRRRRARHGRSFERADGATTCPGRDRRRDDALGGGARASAPASARRAARACRKYVVTEQVDADRPGAAARRSASSASRSPTRTPTRRWPAADLSEEEHEVVLHEEEVVVEKRAVPKERVRLDKDVADRGAHRVRGRVAQGARGRGRQRAPRRVARPPGGRRTRHPPGGASDLHRLRCGAPSR